MAGQGRLADCIRLDFGRRQAKRIEAPAAFVDGYLTRKIPELAPETPGVVHLGDQKDVRHGDVRPEAVRTRGREPAHLFLQRCEPLPDPMVDPPGDGSVIRAVLTSQPGEDPEVVDRVDISTDDAGHTPDPRPRIPVGRE